MKYDIVGLGTALVDFTPVLNANANNPIYECNPGGSIANYLVAAARQGSKCAIMGKVGEDSFGHILEKALKSNGVDCKGLLFDSQKNTPCSFVSLDERGERSFLFYNRNMADTAFSESDIEYTLLQQTRSFHVTSFMFAGDAAFNSALVCLHYARERGTLITFDVNWRPFIWGDHISTGMERIRRVIKLTDILKVSEEELEVFTGCSHAEERKGAEQLLACGPQMVVVTAGAGGSSFYTRESFGHARAESVKAVDTTGAGDCCFAVFIHEFLRQELSATAKDQKRLTAALEYANHAASYCVMRRGGIDAMPGREDLCCEKEGRPA